MIPLDEKDIQRFWSKIDKSGECWVWTAYRLPSGYGQISIKKKLYLASRVSYAIAHGVLPDHLHVCHHCDNPPCVRPDHLWLGTDKDNHQDMIRKGRDLVGERNPMYGKRRTWDCNPAYGERHPGAKLTWETVDAIRSLYRAGGITQTDLGKIYGVGQTLIGKVVRNEGWPESQRPR